MTKEKNFANKKYRFCQEKKFQEKNKFCQELANKKYRFCQELEKFSQKKKVLPRKKKYKFSQRKKVSPIRNMGFAKS